MYIELLERIRLHLTNIREQHIKILQCRQLFYIFEIIYLTIGL